MGKRQKDFLLNPVDGYVSNGLLSWKSIQDGQRRQAAKRRGKHNTGGGQTFQETFEPLATIGSSAVASIPAGLTGLGIGAIDAIRGGKDPLAQASRAAENVQAQLTYLPRTERGQQLSQPQRGLLA